MSLTSARKMPLAAFVAESLTLCNNPRGLTSTCPKNPIFRKNAYAFYSDEIDISSFASSLIAMGYRREELARPRGVLL